MDSCNHRHLILVALKKKKLRCHHCHITIDIDELRSRYCPECFEVTGKKRYDFEEADSLTTDITQYRCEDCGVTIDCHYWDTSIA